jgi:hypothetical protein
MHEHDHRAVARDVIGNRGPIVSPQSPDACHARCTVVSWRAGLSRTRAQQTAMNMVGGGRIVPRETNHPARGQPHGPG